MKNETPARGSRKTPKNGGDSRESPPFFFAPYSPENQRSRSYKPDYVSAVSRRRMTIISLNARRSCDRRTSLPPRRRSDAQEDAAYPRPSDEQPGRLFCLAPEGVCRAAVIADERGGLLPHLFTLTARLPARRFVFCGTIRQRALKRAARPRPCDLDRHPALRCPDFPLRRDSLPGASDHDTPWDAKEHRSDHPPRDQRAPCRPAHHQSSRIPIKNLPALIADPQLRRIRAARARLRLARNLQVAASALAPAQRHHHRPLALQNALVNP